MKQADLIRETHDSVIQMAEHLKTMNGKLIAHENALEAHSKEISAQREKVSKLGTWYVVRGWALAVAAFVIGILSTKVSF